MKTVPVAGRTAFTLVEVLVVVVLSLVLAAMLLLVFAAAKPKKSGALCINNLHQVILAWVSYAQDYNDKLVPCVDVSGSVSNRAWVSGDMSSPTDSINLDRIKTGLLYLYAPNVKLWKCPQDRRTQDWPQTNGALTVRSLSMNGFLNPVGITNAAEAPGGATFGAATIFRSVPMIAKPSMIWLTIEEHPNTINDPAFWCQYAGNTTSIKPGVFWGDIPAVWHNGAASVSFTDGHSEVHKWKDKTIKNLTPKASGGKGAYNFGKMFQVADPADLVWLAERTSY